MGALALADRRALGPAAVRGAVIDRMSAPVQPLVEAIGHKFTDPAILEQALIHPSAAKMRGPTYQRLEFLGDRVLGLAVADMVYAAFPEADEGELSRRLTLLVRRETCAEVAREIGLGAYLRLGGGEAQSGGRAKEAILADACEAVIGALYLDGGYAAAKAFVERRWAERMKSVTLPLKDAKTALQEWAHAQGLGTPVYAEVERSGPDHRPMFTISVEITGLPPAAASGTSKRVAEQAAAELLLRREGGRDNGAA